jgi:hypothetical protein
VAARPSTTRLEALLRANENPDHFWTRGDYTGFLGYAGFDLDSGGPDQQA